MIHVPNKHDRLVVTGNHKSVSAYRLSLPCGSFQRFLSCFYEPYPMRFQIIITQRTHGYFHPKTRTQGANLSKELYSNFFF